MNYIIIPPKIVKFKCPGCKTISDNTDNIIFFKCKHCNTKVTKDDMI